MLKIAANAKLFIGGLLAAQFALNAITMESALAAETSVKPHIDLAFCIDTTGSMQNEIDNVKAKTKQIVARLSGGKPIPVIRVGLVAFRDRGDEYVTKVFPFTDDIDKVVNDISSLQAAGGGDGPESVNEALHVAVNDLKWDDSKKTLKMLFLIGDAGPHQYPQDYDWKTESRKAVGKGIQINTLACQGLESYPEPDGVGVFKEIAKLSDGRFEALSYRQEVADAAGHKSTVVASGGKLYKVSPAADWREGVSNLAARGAVLPAALPAPIASARAKGAKMAGYSMEAYSGGAVDRKENNLADVVLSTAKEEAKKRLNVEFK